MSNQEPGPSNLINKNLQQAESRASSMTNASSSASRNRSTSVTRRKSRPHLRKSASVSHPRLIYSVDDDINEQEGDYDDDGKKKEDGEAANSKNDRDYMDGYNDALRALSQRRRSKSPIRSYSDLNGNGSQGFISDAQEDDSRKRDSKKRIAREDGDGGGDAEEQQEGDAPSDEGDEQDADSVHSNSSVESLNLKERQNAINSTHPFGIKIWKPSLYKKNRSVATRADEDIHDFEPRRPTAKIYWGVKLTNIIWSLTAGLVIYIFCLIGAAIVFVFSGFGLANTSRPYAAAFLKLGRYLLYPFGKFVLLNKDQNYLDEDHLEGRTLDEFHQWRLQEEGRLFFAPPRRFTGTSDSTPLVKDHKGRPLRDAYSSLTQEDDNDVAPETIPEDQDNNDFKVRFFGRGNWSVGRIAFYVYFYVVLQPISYVIGLLCWLVVFTIPMANLTGTLNYHMRRHPLALDFEPEKEFYKKRDENPRLRKKKQMILLCTYRCCGVHYYKYTLDGTNIFFINLISVVLFVIFDYFFLKETLHWETFLTDAKIIFCLCLFSIIPLAYFIGQAVASISAQSSMGVGAVINAFFSTIVEIFLYCVALDQAKGKLVEGSMIGSILGGVLLLPGLSMCGGALKRKTQRYNPRSAGVSSTMLLFAMVIMFAPSLFYQIYGAYEIKCMDCKFNSDLDDCTTCRFTQPSFTLDPLYYRVIKPFSLIVAIALFAAYVCGLYFTLKTHASLIWATTSHEATKKEDYHQSPSVSSMQANPKSQNLNQQLIPSKQVVGAEGNAKKEHEENEHGGGGNGGGHDAPNWSRNKSIAILLGATLLYAVIAEILVDNVDAILADFPINPKFLGLTIFALVPNTTEFLNAISFAIGGNVALSMEIGSAYALQVVLIQIPSLVLYSMIKNFVNVEQIFSLVFPRWDIIATLISIYLFTYIYAEGKSNYFKGVILILVYFVVLIGFWFNDIIEDLDDGYGTLAKSMSMGLRIIG
ncbi:uncharacterized protein LODBEIA_P20130 [Lodderomyces beijingensis]|uniref:Calcium permease n=1 Tax=Lodderomyces beijingensis TaxID=1775926 RepID=A0ABP0ZIU4_9ASCO